jgi:hypothetical protein
MPKKITTDGVVLLLVALCAAYLGSMIVKEAGKEMGATAGGTILLGLLVGAAAHALPKPKTQ